MTTINGARHQFAFVVSSIGAFATATNVAAVLQPFRELVPELDVWIDDQRIAARSMELAIREAISRGALAPLSAELAPAAGRLAGWSPERRRLVADRLGRRRWQARRSRRP